MCSSNNYHYYYYNDVLVVQFVLTIATHKFKFNESEHKKYLFIGYILKLLFKQLLTV